jgi:predicted transcriptional regulator
MKFIKSSKNLSCGDVISCLFDFNDLDLNVYKKLREEGESRTDALAIKLKKERSTVYRSLQKLTNCGLCIKKTKKITKGGYYHTYSCTDEKIVKNKVESCIDDWYQSMKEIIKIFDF